jgi:hypothetical protein
MGITIFWDVTLCNLVKVTDNSAGSIASIYRIER